MFYSYRLLCCFIFLRVATTLLRMKFLGTSPSWYISLTILNKKSLVSSPADSHNFVGIWSNMGTYLVFSDCMYRFYFCILFCFSIIPYILVFYVFFPSIWYFFFLLTILFFYNWSLCFLLSMLLLTSGLICILLYIITNSFHQFFFCFSVFLCELIFITLYLVLSFYLSSFLYNFPCHPRFIRS